MATRDDVLDAIDRIERAGGAGEATRVAQAALTLPLPPSGYDRVLSHLGSTGDQQQGRAAQSIKLAEAALAQQLSAAADFDRQIIEALRHAHKTTLEGRRRLDDLEVEIAGTAGSWDLSTAAGAREFQRFLVDRLGQIIKVVEETNDDDASKEALATALTGLYRGAPSDRHQPPPAADDQAFPVDPVDPDTEPYPDLLADDQPETDDQEAPQRLPQWAPPMFPGMGSDGSGFGAMPAAMPSGFPITGPTPGWGRDDLPAEDDDLPEESAAADPLDGADADADDETSEQEPGERGPVTVQLPDGETTTVANPQLAAAMQAVADGQSVVEAFRSQGMHVPPPGTPVVAAVDVASLRPGDIAVFTDRHALAVGAGKALLDGQVHLVENLRGPGFLGWQHPPALAQEPAPPTEPVATRPARALGGLMRLKNAAPTVIVD
ncbi:MULTISPECIES: DUF4226 domain-containing protein [Mycolicibacter]|uniref:DUF4226 domain-containing protein n=1 Tax=Mycolicibacter virginiensis TaxID=1795032 RepID=A0A9X7NXR4_9MYCO|nr:MULTISPECIES: DUF4226 domain-containing protein [Mycolicibacter]OBJ28532.1 hypothetical protein A5631_20855 [Mycolicibacter heraklionensis]PQM51219.1 DUF4226 domain-containing protein [Mycolicibacter virginiensis]ULP47656.1 DUF4226 domain-containing protein [Mycolicibacter virginiensis]